jgi:hypothetical protein
MKILSSNIMENAYKEKISWNTSIMQILNANSCNKIMRLIDCNVELTWNMKKISVVAHAVKLSVSDGQRQSLQ